MVVSLLLGAFFGAFFLRLLASANLRFFRICTLAPRLFMLLCLPSSIDPPALY